MAVISRDIGAAAKTEFDLIVVGAGIHGALLLLEAGLRGKRALLLEKDDFNSATSWNNLRTIHGGLRYLQSLDLPRYFESVADRHWFLANFPALVEVLPCLMPLYGRGLMRTSVMGAGLLLNEVLSLGRNRGVAAARRLPKGRIVNRRFIAEAYPLVDRHGLKSGALWYDGAIPEHQRLFMEILRWGCALGGTALNYVQAEGLLQHNAQARGVLAVDRLTGSRHEFRAAVVINVAGPWCREIAQKFDRDYPTLFRRRLLLFNILFKRKALSGYALALVPPHQPTHTYFVHNWKDRMLAGTGEVLLADENAGPEPRPEHVASFIADLNDAVPDLDLSEKDIEHVYPGILPTTPGGSQARREVIINHRDHDGPQGLFSVSGAKYTTARYVADKALRRVFPKAARRPAAPPAEANSGRGCFPYDWSSAVAGPGNLAAIKSLIEEEAVVHLDDLLLRRCGLGENRRRVLELLPILRPLFPWNDLRWQQESERLKSLLLAQP